MAIIGKTEGAFEILHPGMCCQFGSNKLINIFYRFGRFLHCHLVGRILNKPTQDPPVDPDLVLGMSKGPLYPTGSLLLTE